MAKGPTMDAALAQATARHAAKKAGQREAAKRLYESGRPLKAGSRALRMDEKTVRALAVEHGWKRGAE